eukprot:jgi/Phyca11/128360/e_gw1.75.126.1
MFVGRTVAGLPILDAGFATLPPRFQGGREQVEAAKRIGFRHLPQCASLTSDEFALASIVYHFDYLKENLPENHTVFQSPLMRNEQTIQELKRFIKCGKGDDNISPTSVPPHVVLLSEFRSLKAVVEKQQAEQHNLANDVITVVNSSNNFPLYTWGGGFHAFPEDVLLPEGTVEQAWGFWCCGDPARSLPPFRRLKSIDLKEKKHRKRLSDLKFLMGLIE